MKNVLIIYKIFKDISQKDLQEIVNGCKSSLHQVTIHIHDFTLSKQLKFQVQDLEFSGLKAISIFNQNYEDMHKSDRVVAEKLIPFSDFDIVSILGQDIILDGCIDKIDFSIMDDQAIGSIYTDCYVSAPLPIRMYYKSHPLMQSGIRCIFTRMSKLISAMSEDNPITHIYGNSASHHIPQPLFTINAIKNE